MQYSEKIKKQHSGLSAQEIRANKCTRAKARNEARRADRRAEAEFRQEGWRALSKREQLESLTRRPGQCKKQIAKILGDEGD